MALACDPGHINSFSELALLPDGTLVTVYHYFADEPRPVQFIESVRWRLAD